MGPVWDFDIGMDAPDEKLRCVDIYADSAVNGIGKREDITFIDLLCSHQTILDAMAERFSEIAGLFSTKLNEQTDAMFSIIEASAKTDQIRWGYLPGSRSDINLSEYPINRSDHMLSDFNNLTSLIQTRKEELTKSQVDTTNKYSFIIIFTISAVVTGSVGLIVLKSRLRNKERKKI